MYTVMIADDGMFSAEYVVPPALRIPLGTSGSTVDVVRNEDGTFSADGEVITAETRVTAANGNVYAAVLSPEGVPVSVMHVAAMQDVMLGALGGTVKLTQAEDMSWWLGETAVADGYVHTHANGNMYALMMDAEGMWSAMYQKVEVMVSLGTQGSVTLERAEDMSWWLGSEAVDVASEVMSDSGNTYTLWYTDGVWSTRFEPESMMIEGTGLVAMTKEDRSGYDVDGADLPGALPALGTDIDTSMGSYRVTMSDGKLMGTRLDNVAIEYASDYKVGDVDLLRDHTNDASRVALIRRDEDDTEDVNEALTALTLGGQDDHYAFGDLLDDGVSQTTGKNIVAKAREDLEGIRDQIEAIVEALADSQHQEQVDRLWGTSTDTDAPNRRTNVNSVLEEVFGDAEISRGPEADDALEEVGKLITALSSVDGLAAALDVDGVFEDVDPKSMTAAEIFDATSSEATVTYGMVGQTRFGTIYREQRDNALEDAEYTRDDPATDDDEGVGQLGAFAFGVTADTDRHRYVQHTGNALYEGTTLAIDQDGMNYEGDINIRIRFSNAEVDGLVTNLTDTDGNPWRYFFDEVESIVLPTGGITGATAKWDTKDDTEATLTYGLQAGNSTPNEIADATFEGILLGGNGADAGNQAVGTWSIGANPGSSTYLAGGFGAERTEDAPDRGPGVVDVTGTDTVLVTLDAEGDPLNTSLRDGKLTVTVPKSAYERDDSTLGDLGINTTWSWARADADNPRTAAVEENNALRKYEFDLTALADKAWAASNKKGDTWVNMAREMIESERDKLASLIDFGDDFVDQARGRWQRIQEILFTYVLIDSAGSGLDSAPGADTSVAGATAFTGRLPEQVSGTYADLRNPLRTVDDIISALSSADNLEAALDPDEDGLFVEPGDPAVEGAPATAFVNRPSFEIWGQVDSQMYATFGSTDYTRFGVWRVRDNRNGSHDGWNWGTVEAFAYSPLPKAEVNSVESPAFPKGETASYTGKTVAYIHNNTVYEGDVTLTVTWNNTVLAQGSPGYVNDGRQGVGGTLTTVLSNLANTGNGDQLTHDGAPVRDLVFPALIFATDTTGDSPDHTLKFALEGTADVSVRYVDRNAPRGTEAVRLHDGMFVGSTSDGPLAVIGRYGFASGFGNAAGSQVLNGAYGAERP